MIPPLCHLMAHYSTSENQLLGWMVSIIKSNMHDKDSSNASSHGSSSHGSRIEKLHYFATNNKESLLINRAFGNYILKNNKKLHSHIKNLHQSSPHTFWSRWMHDLFIDVIPQCILWRVLDLYLVEGFRGLVAFGYTLLNHFKSRIFETKDLSTLQSLFHSDSSLWQDMTVFDEIFKACLKLNIKKLDSSKNSEHHPTLAHISSDDLLNSSSHYRYQRGLPKFITSLVSKPSNKVSSTASNNTSQDSIKKQPTDLLATSTVIQSDYWIALWSWIPPNKRLDSIELVFTTREHGTHISTLYRLTQGIAPMILIIETMEGSIFGAYLSQKWIHESETRGEFYGNGETFVFTLKPFAKLYPWIGRLENDAQTPSQNVNSYSTNLFVQSRDNSLIIGGGSGNALVLQETLVKGETDHCKTFENGPLTGTKAKTFEILTVEVFAFR